MRLKFWPIGRAPLKFNARRLALCTPSTTPATKEKAPHDAGPRPRISLALLLSRILLSRLVILATLLSALSGVLRLLSRLLVRLAALLLSVFLVLSALVLLAAVLILILIGH